MVDGSYPFSSIDQNILSGGEQVYVYFGPQNRVTLSSSSISTLDTLTVSAQAYDYENNNWEIRTGVTIGLTQPNPADPFNPTEIMTSPVDANGQATFSSIVAGNYNVGVKEDFYFPTQALTVNTPPSTGVGSGSGSSTSSSKQSKEGSVLGVETKASFDLKKAFEFLVAQQKENGSFGEEIYTDWVAVSLAGSDQLSATLKLIKYFSEKVPEGKLLTDYERHAMALMTLGLNPYNTKGENYIEKITSSFDGRQFGDINEDNDDIFALIVLQNAGFKNDEKMISDSLSFVLERQKENGSFDESVDMTGAGMQALSNFTENEKVQTALEKAKEFLKESQKNDGGWGNASSTAWAMGGILALTEKIEDWKKGDLTAFDYLATLEDIDGGIKNSSTDETQKMKTKIWETAYVATAYSGKTWNQIMQKFEKQEIKEINKKIISAPKPETKTQTPENFTPEPELQKETKKENWFMRLLNFIF